MIASGLAVRDFSGPGRVLGSRPAFGVPVRVARPPRRLGGRNGCPSRLLTPISSREGAQAPCRVCPQSAPFRTRAPHKDPSMSNILVINASGQETRVALIEQGTISEYYLERKNEKGIVGNVYKGRVVRVLPGMQAAFVDIGLDKAAFLYVADIVSDPSFPGFSEEIEIQAGATEGDTLDVEDVAEPPAEDVAPAAVSAAPETALSPPAQEGPPPTAGEASAPAPAAASTAPSAEEQAPAEGKMGVPAEQRPAARERRGRRRGGRGRRRGGPGKPAEDRGGKPAERQQQARDRQGERKGNGHAHGKRAQIQDLLKEGDEVIVQVVKDPIGSKGARITCHISLPGRHLVFMPTVDHVGISRRIENEKERRRLRELVDRFRPPGTGFIVRTVAESEPEEKLTADIKFLLGLWNEVGKKRESMKAPACVHPDLDLILRSIRDLFSDEVEKLVIDDRSEFERVRAFVEQAAPELKERIELYGGEEPIFDEYGIEQELIRAQNRKVWLKSGGYIIIDQTEALVAIDVNSGRYVGKKGAGASLEDTITKINSEAAKEIVYQLRLRNIGGIIIIDFIDIDKGSNREKVVKTLQEALGADRAKTNILKISDIALVDMTRKPVRETITRLTTELCPTCDGRGHVRSKTTMAYDIMREVQRAAGKHREDQLEVPCHPRVAKLLQGPEREAMRLLMMKLNKSITVRPQPQYHLEQYDLHAKWSRPELQQAQRGQGRREAGRRDGNRGQQQQRAEQPVAQVEPRQPE